MLEKICPIKIGFTGTQIGMTNHQYISFTRLMEMIFPLASEYHHGDCIGADKQFHDWIALCHNMTRFDIDPITIVIHPPDNPTKRAFCKFSGNLEIRPEKPYLERDLDIATETDLLIATPKEYQEVLRSGTWSTIRYSRKQHKPIYIIYPNGEIIKCGTLMTMTTNCSNLF